MGVGAIARDFVCRSGYLGQERFILCAFGVGIGAGAGVRDAVAVAAAARIGAAVRAAFTGGGQCHEYVVAWREQEIGTLKGPDEELGCIVSGKKGSGSV
jgi:hypothetical protein